MAKAEKLEKTNAIRALERAKLPYEVHSYPHGDAPVDALTVAAMIGRPAAQVFKTLVTQGHSKAYFVFVLPAAGELDLKAAARAVGEKSVEMIPVADINRVTGYMRGGCSPIGMKKAYTTVVDESCLTQERIIVSAGKIGMQIDMAPTDLLAFIGASTAHLTM